MKKKSIKIILFFFLSLLFLQACTGTKDCYNGKTARPDQIHTITGNAHSGVWKTAELSVDFVYTSSKPDNFNITGDISISDHITNTFSKVLRLNVRVSFLDSSGKVLATSVINPVYSINSVLPEKIKFNVNLSLPAEAVAFCFSYSGKFQAAGNDGRSDTLYIGQNPFH